FLDLQRLYMFWTAGLTTATYGVTHVLARDGYSGKIVSYLSLPVKNNVAIYDQVFRYDDLKYRSSVHSQCHNIM
ncbi:MAG: hypothetical protein MJE68_31675, partial [Proteobacteria bacterium]|nr:hypothetical protein [Pseudomonadota bacterium]